MSPRDREQVPAPEPTADPAADERAAALADPLLTDYARLGSVALTDAERWPTLSSDELARVAEVRAGEHAPVWEHETGDRLDADDLRALRERVYLPFALPTPCPALSEPPRSSRTARSARTPVGPAPTPSWVDDLVRRAHATVPRYRAAARAGTSGPTSPLHELAPVTRADLVADLAAHVPLDVPLDRVLEGSSSGSTGAALVVPLHPRTVASDLLVVHALVEAAGISWARDPGMLALANVVDQRAAFTYVSALSAFPRADGVPAPLMARVNLDDAAWREAGDRERWFEAHDPQVISTMTLPLLHLLDLADAGLTIHPLAVVTGATHVTPAVRERVAATWGAPLVDVYALRETGPVAASLDGRGHVVVGRRVHVEVLDDDGRALPDGERGEVVVTVDENPYLPLLRYRTGDTAVLVHDERGTVLVDLEGRTPVRYRDASGAWRPSVDAVQVLQAAGLLAWHLHQDADGGVRLTAVPPPGRGAHAADEAARALEAWLGRPVTVTTTTDARDLGPGKPRRFTTELTPSG